MTRYNLFFDGACPGNGKKNAKMAIGVYIEIFEKKGSKPKIVNYCKFIGRGGTNNEAEYCALYLGLKIIFDKFTPEPSDKIYVYGDSNLVIKQVSGEWQCKKEHLQYYHFKILAYKSKLEKDCMKFKHIYREENEIADYLANKGLELEKKKAQYIKE